MFSLQESYVYQQNTSRKLMLYYNQAYKLIELALFCFLWEVLEKHHFGTLKALSQLSDTSLQVYSDYESNPQLRRAIEFACRQFYILHRKPFVLQLFASVAPLLEFPVSKIISEDQSTEPLQATAREEGRHRLCLGRMQRQAETSQGSRVDRKEA